MKSDLFVKFTYAVKYFHLYDCFVQFCNKPVHYIKIMQKTWFHNENFSILKYKENNLCAIVFL